ncbi:hypothetical protein [Flavobacterium sp. LAR06]|uniref:hypothetical protein n=1 Tax=Flavobacterium sp. LAR06 TaxID=3064897 RepID=UPI0035BFE550
MTDYVYYDYYEGGSKFNYTKAGTNIDTVFEKGTIKDYQDTYTILALFIDEKGKLISVFTGFDVVNSEPQLKYDPVFGLLSEFNVTSKRPLNDFEIDAINLIKQVKDWEVKEHNITKVPVKYIHYKKWKYEY